MSYGIPDDPIISCMERTGYPPWIDDADYEEIDEGDSPEESEDEE